MSNASADIDTLLITQNTKITIVFIIRLINAEIVPDTTIINFGKLILRIKSPRETIDCNPCTVASVKKFHNTIPTNKYTGKCSISLPRRKNLSNTIYRINKNIGFKIDHK